MTLEQAIEWVDAQAEPVRRAALLPLMPETPAPDFPVGEQEVIDIITGAWVAGRAGQVVAVVTQTQILMAWFESL